MPTDRCPYCREIIEPGSRFCGNCGRALPAPSAAPAAAPSAAPSAAPAAAPAAKTLFMASGAAVLKQVHARLAQDRGQDQPAGSAPAQALQAGRQASSAAQVHSQPAQASAAAQVHSQPAQASATAQAPQAQIQATDAQNAETPQKDSLLGPMARLRATGSLLGVTLNNRYEVIDRIGEGGFGTIYLGKQIQMDREVALKVLNPYMSDDPKLVERFRREAKAACNLKDPHTIITYDFDQTPDGVLYLAIEYLRGKTLFELLEEAGGLSVERTVHILSQCCSSLAEAHQQGIVHRDIKPENIFLEERPGHSDYVKVLDFGIAKIVSGDAAQSPALTAAGQTLGTLEYMSPEQLTGKPLDGRSDIYALGILAYEMLTGTLPFESDNPAAIISGHLREQPLPPSKRAPEAGIPEALDGIVLKMLSKNREERYRDAASLKKDLDALIRSSGTLRALRDHDQPKSKGSHYPLIALALVAALGVTALILHMVGVF